MKNKRNWQNLMISNAVRNSLIASSFVAIASLFGSSSALAGTASASITMNDTYAPSLSLSANSTNNPITMDAVGFWTNVGSLTVETNNFSGVDVIANPSNLVSTSGGSVPVRIGYGTPTSIQVDVTGVGNLLARANAGSFTTHVYVSVNQAATVPGIYTGIIQLVATDR